MEHDTPRPQPRLGALRAPGEQVDRFDLDQVLVARTPRLAGILGTIPADTPAPAQVAARNAERPAR